MEKQLIKLKAKIQGITANMESRSKKLHGVLCSRSDFDVIEMYIDLYLRQGNINGLMKPMGNVKEVFDKANIEFN